MTVATAALSRLAPDGSGYALTALLGGVPYQTSMLDWVPDGDGGVVATIASQIDLAALRLGTKKVDDRISLTLNSEGMPQRLVRASGGQSLALDLIGGRAKAVLHDGTQLDVEADVSVIVDGNSGILTAIAIAIAVERGEAIEGRRRVLIAGQLLAIDYGLKPADEGRWQSTLDEDLTVSGDGVLTDIVMATQGLRIRLATPDEITLLRVPPDDAERWPAVVSDQQVGPGHREIDVRLSGNRAVAALVRTTARPARGVALLLAGSGQVDRFGMGGGIDTGIGRLADALARADIMAMTADRQGAGRTPTGADVLERGYRSEVDEAASLVAAAAKLTNPPCLPVLIGHSLGGLTALAVAAERAVPIAALVLLATPGRQIDRVMEDQIEWIAGRRGLARDAIDKQIDEHRVLMAAMRSDEEWSAATVPEKFLAQARLRPWLKGLLTLDPVALIERVNVPVFIGQGDRDVQVSAVRDFQSLAAAAGPRSDHHLYPGVDHMLNVVDDDGAIENYARADRAIDPRLLADVVAFTRNHCAVGATQAL